ncbi:midasin-like [Acipenser ruthenus]|uniref:midasin-like n=1 Tax=Acipenser ruthenus TaxID=7906 RepID=UPI0027419603|nr:midasin-like [Acipenser ruthenus]
MCSHASGRCWQDLLKLMDHVCKSAVNKEPQKKQQNAAVLKEQWEAFSLRLSQAQQQIKLTETALVFALVEVISFTLCFYKLATDLALHPACFPELLLIHSFTVPNNITENCIWTLSVCESTTTSTRTYRSTLAATLPIRPGSWSSEKVLSRAFRNRFVELHFDELPSGELESILHKRCSLPPSYCTKLIRVMLELQSHRRGSTAFAGKHGFITLRDLFRCAERYRLAEENQGDYDWLQHLANDGFMLLAGRVRKPEEAALIQGVLEKHFKKKLNPGALFSQDNVSKQKKKLARKKERGGQTK